ncbi:MAG: pallilysin-related adhesin [Spirochaetaceae bacterium]
MKPYRISVITTMAAMLLGGLLFGCAEEQEPPPTVERNQVVVPEAGEGIRLASEGRPELSIRTQEAENDVNVRMPEGAVPSQAIDVNLDVDEPDEQIIVFKRRDDTEDRIHLLVADYDSIRNSYVPAWEGTTEATNLRTFAVYTKDLTGDHDLEIVALGTDNEGRQTLDIFKRASAFGGVGLRYRHVASFNTDASIEIQETERSDAYQSVQTGGVSFPIVVYRQDEDSDDVPNLIRETYRWRDDEDTYVETGTEEVSGTRMEEEQLNELYESDSEAFDQFLAGPWYRATGDEVEEAGEIIFFDPTSDRITLHGGETLESYEWVDSHKTVFRDGPGIWVNVRNEPLANIRRQISISVEAIDRVSLRFEDAENWNGTYRKLTPRLRDTLLAGDGDPARATDAELSGLYSNESGTEIFFASPRFTMRTEDEELQGGFAAYHLNDDVLRLKITNENGLVVDNRTYAFDYSENVTDRRIVRRLELTPARVRVTGVEPTSNETITLEQTEELEDDEEGENGEAEGEDDDESEEGEEEDGSAGA